MEACLRRSAGMLRRGWGAITCGYGMVGPRRGPSADERPGRLLRRPLYTIYYPPSAIRCPLLPMFAPFGDGT